MPRPRLAEPDHGTPNGARQHYRNGTAPCDACHEADRARRGRNPAPPAAPRRESRNGLPWKPYRYQGLGYDQLTGDTDE